MKSMNLVGALKIAGLAILWVVNAGISFLGLLAAFGKILRGEW